MTWTPDSWKSKKLTQIAAYQKLPLLEASASSLKKKPGIVKFAEILELKRNLANVVAGKAIVLQIGDCVERFSDFTLSSTNRRLNFYNFLANELGKKLNKQIVIVGRIGGQFAKPRTQVSEDVRGQQIPIYRGDLFHSQIATKTARAANPARLISGYQFARQSYRWVNLFNQKSENFIFTSHEALHPYYESALTKKQAHNFYATSAHLLWLGVRTNFRESAQLEFLSGVANPVAVKIDSHCTVDQIRELIARLNPQHSIGKLIFISRMGADKIEKYLPDLLEATIRTNSIWICDPLHGNTQKSIQGHKFRLLDEAILELKLYAQILEQMGLPFQGIHLEATPDPIKECLGRNENPKDWLEVLDQPVCDPRLNHEQTKEILSFVPHTI